MQGVDLSIYRFDYDLTFCSLLMNADGTTYHVYGGRDWRSPKSHLSMSSLVRTLTGGLADHVAYQRHPRPPKKTRRRVVEDLPPLKRQLAQGKTFECIHCHSVRDFQREDERERKRFRRSEIWVHPDPQQIGLRLDRDEQERVTEVVPDSPAARAGLKPGDRLSELAGHPVRTFGDVQQALEEASAKATRLPVVWLRGSEERRASVALPAHWKERTPLLFAWRPSKWPLSPKPGFGGPVLDAAQKQKLGIAEDAFAFRVQYLVTWGPNKYTGQNAARAGLRKGDVVTRICGRQDFQGMDHFHAWFRLTQKVGSTCEIEILRRGKQRTLKLPVIE